jgi:hypothetical protein
MMRQLSAVQQSPLPCRIRFAGVMAKRSGEHCQELIFRKVRASIATKQRSESQQETDLGRRVVI